MTEQTYANICYEEPGKGFCPAYGFLMAFVREYVNDPNKVFFLIAIKEGVLDILPFTANIPPEVIWDFLGKWDGKAHIYFTPNPRDLSKCPDLTQKKTHGREDCVPTGKFLFIDIDPVKIPRDKSLTINFKVEVDVNRYLKTYDKNYIYIAPPILPLLEGFPRLPLYISYSGKGWHVYFKSDRDLPRETWAQLEGWIVAILKVRLQRYTIDGKTVGEIDERVKYISHLMRVPYTINLDVNLRSSVVIENVGGN